MTNPTDPRVEAAVDAVIKARGWRDNCWGDGAIGGFDYSTDDKKRHVIRDHEAEAKEGKTVILFETEDYDEYQREYRRICVRREVRAALKAADKASWQPIESVPVEGKFILTDGVDVAEGSRSVLGSGFVRYDRAQAGDGYCVCYEEWEPSRWRPLPTPPKAP